MPLDMGTVEAKLDEIGRGFEEFKSTMTTRLAEIDKGAADVVTTEKFDRIAADLAKLGEEKAEMERRLNRAETEGLMGGTDARKANDDERKAFVSAMRRKSAYAELEQKAVDADFSSNSTAGGVAIPETIASDILAKLKDISPMRSLVRVTSVGNPNYERLVDVKGTASGWAAEGTTRSETSTSTIQRVTFTHGELYAVPKASNWALNDIQFDVVSWLTESVAEEFAYQEGVAICTGNGTNKPTGFLNGTPTSAGDEASPARAFGTIQYLPTGTAGAFQNDRLGSPAGLPDEVFVNTAYALKAGYRRNARWVMNKATLSVIMKFHDADGRPIWHPGLAMGQPDTILRYPITEAEAMPDIGANTFPVAFGDFHAGYELIDITGMSLIRDDVTSKGHVLFYVARRLGGKLVNDDAIKAIKAAAS